MIKPADEVLLGVKVPTKLKRKVSEFCDRNGMKIKYFVAEAIKDKLVETLEDAYDNSVAEERLKEGNFVSFDDFEKNVRKEMKKRK